jgi:hypothetical protein
MDAERAVRSCSIGDQGQSEDFRGRNFVMARIRLLGLAVATLGLVFSHATVAGTISTNPFQTGNVETDFSKLSNVNVTPVISNPINLVEASFIPANGWVSGWAIKSIDTSYNATTDTLYVGLDTFKNAKGIPSIVGDADGNGIVGGANGASPQMKATGGVENTNLGGLESVAVAFAPNAATGKTGAGAPAIIAGVPADKSTAGSGIDGFTVSNFKGSSMGLGYSFGGQTSLKSNAGSLAFDPSASHPGFEFTINKFSTLLGGNPKNGYWISAYAGSPTDVVAGGATLGWTKVTGISATPAAGHQVPEPTTWVAWGLVASGLLAHRFGRRIINIR